MIARSNALVGLLFVALFAAGSQVGEGPLALGTSPLGRAGQ